MSARFANGCDFGMRRGVAVVGHLVVAPSDDLTVFDYHCTERAAVPLSHPLKGEPDGFAHEVLVLFVLVYLHSDLCVGAIADLKALSFHLGTKFH